jgi:hypothetical protein
MKEWVSLKLYVEKAEKLLNTRFVKHLKETGKLSASISIKEGEEVKMLRILPDQDAIDAFVLTFRFFIQDNDHEEISFRRLSENFEKLPISPELKKQFVEQRSGLNNYLDSKINMNLYGFTPSRRELLDIFIYGGLAHANTKKKAIYDSWKKNETTFIFVELHFCSTLEFVLRVICNVGYINKRAILENQKASDAKT